MDNENKSSPMVMNGATTLNSVTIQDELTVNGAFNATNAHFTNSLCCNGSVCLDTVQVTQRAIISGSLEARNTTFNELEIMGSSSLEQCTVNNIVVKPVPGFLWGSATITVQLFGGVVEGDITFEGGRGVVVLHKGAQVKGAVIGGEVKK